MKLGLVIEKVDSIRVIHAEKLDRSREAAVNAIRKSRFNRVSYASNEINPFLLQPFTFHRKCLTRGI